MRITKLILRWGIFFVPFLFLASSFLLFAWLCDDKEEQTNMASVIASDFHKLFLSL